MEQRVPFGSAYVQYFKYYKVYVNRYAAEKETELVRSWGADKIIDYKTEDFTKDARPVSLAYLRLIRVVKNATIILVCSVSHGCFSYTKNLLIREKTR